MASKILSEPVNWRDTLAEKMRAIVKEGHPDESLTDMSELLLMYAARSQLVENVIQPAIAQGNFVVGDRHDFSSQAYQGGGRGVDLNILMNLRQTVLGDLDLTSLCTWILNRFGT